MNKTKFGDVLSFFKFKFHFICNFVFGGAVRATQLIDQLQNNVEREGIFEKENK